MRIFPLDRLPSFSVPWLARLLYRALADSLNVGGGLLANDKGGTACWKECQEQVLNRLKLDIWMASHLKGCF